NTVVKENVITNGHGYGIFFYSTDGGTAQTANNTITQNYVTTDSAGILFEANTGSAGTQNNTVSYNILNQCGGASPEVAAAFFLMGSAANPATGTNYFVNNTIYAGNTLGMLILQNNLGYWTFENNIIYGTGSHWYMAQSGAASHYVIDYNLYPTGALDAFYDTSNPQTFTSWQAIGFDLHSPTPANIQFANSSGSYSLPSDFKLLSTSPAIGTGVNVGLTLDYAGDIVSSPPDIGAYEYIGKDKNGRH
ncbi:MAG TPA: choice-of-anchor Q domain-containing protein, partial [Dissulfurispiraceae bacterium]|nr:choice-of-anchor Q domain-containing protein [Dissulfurispiraceae bacterium]